jgi:hypothetical protein
VPGRKINDQPLDFTFGNLFKLETQITDIWLATELFAVMVMRTKEAKSVRIRFCVLCSMG